MNGAHLGGKNPVVKTGAESAACDCSAFPLWALMVLVGRTIMGLWSDTAVLLEILHVGFV